MGNSFQVTSASLGSLILAASLFGCSGSESQNGGVGGDIGVGGSAATGGVSNGGSSSNGTSTSNTNTTGGGSTTSTGGATSANGTNATGGTTAKGSLPGVGGTGNAPPKWTELYNNYFASGCASCHSNGSGGVTFGSAATMCTALKNLGYISSGSASLQTLIKWFNQGGTMPPTGGAAPANAVTDITTWQNAGAVCP